LVAIHRRVAMLEARLRRYQYAQGYLRIAAFAYAIGTYNACCTRKSCHSGKEPQTVSTAEVEIVIDPSNKLLYFPLPENVPLKSGLVGAQPVTPACAVQRGKYQMQAIARKPSGPTTSWQFPRAFASRVHHMLAAGLGLSRAQESGTAYSDHPWNAP
jgi:hypothetical protein